MLNNDTYYFQLTRKYILGIYSIFKDISIWRRDKTEIKIPVNYANKRKYFQWIDRNNDEYSLPRIGISRPQLLINTDAQRNHYNEYDLSFENRNETVTYIQEATSYKATMQITIVTKYENDMYMILEQVLPQFKPNFVMTINEFPELKDENGNNFNIFLRDIPVQLTDVSNDEPEISLEDTGLYITTLSVEFPIFFYPPLRNKKLIQRILINNIDIDDDSKEMELMKSIILEG